MRLRNLFNFEWRLAALKNGFQDATAYRIEFLFEILGSAFVPAAIQIVLWYALFKVGGAETIAGMNYESMIHYTIVSLLFTQVRGGDHDFELQEMIRSGQLSNYLLRPVGVVEFVWIRGAAPRFFVALLGYGIGLLLSFFLPISPLALTAGMILAVMGNIIHYQIGATLATTAFYWEEAYSVLMVKNLLVSFLSGELLPLTLFPESLSWIWKSLPFYIYVFGPTQIALGHWSLADFWGHLLIATGWLFVFAICIRATWSFSIKRYSSLGG